MIVTARYPAVVKKLILIGSGPLEDRYARDITRTRLGRLDEGERAQAHSLMEALEDPTAVDKNGSMDRLVELIKKADSFDPFPDEVEEFENQYDAFRGVWEQARELRSSGALLRLAEGVRCQVVAIHGDYDPHPFEGVEGPLSRVLEDFRFILLERCGHKPWIERGARDRFYDVLKGEVE